MFNQFCKLLTGVLDDTSSTSSEDINDPTQSKLGT